MRALQIAMVGLIGVLVTNCGGSDDGACSGSPLVGSWTEDSNGQTLTFTGSCTFSDNVCNHVGTYPNVTAASGTVLVTIASTGTGASCLPVGPTTCAYDIVDTVLGLNCGAGDGTYIKD